MTEENIKLIAKIRKTLGKKSKKLRREGFLPAVIYGHGVKSLPLQLNTREFLHTFKKAGSNTIITLTIEDASDKKERKVLIHEPQVNPVTDEPIHVDLYEVKMTEKIETQVPLEFENEEIAPAIKELEGTLVKNVDELEISCLPGDIPHDIKVDCSVLKTFEDAIHVKDLPIPENVEVLTELEEVVATVTPPRSEEELAELEEEVVEDVEGVEGAEKPTEEGEEAAEEGKEETAPEAGSESASPDQGGEKPKEEKK